MGQASVPAPLLWDGSRLRAQAVTRHSPGPLGSEPKEGSAPGPLPVATYLPKPQGLAPLLQEPSSSLPNLEDARLTLKGNWWSCFPRSSRASQMGTLRPPKHGF